MLATTQLPDRDPNPLDVYEEPVRECASCLAPLTEDTAIPPVVECGDEKCLSCAAEEDATDIILAELRADFSPTRTIGERTRACDVMDLALRRARERIAQDAERLVARSADAAAIAAPLSPSRVLVQCAAGKDVPVGLVDGECPHGCPEPDCWTCPGRRS